MFRIVQAFCLFWRVHKKVYFSLCNPMFGRFCSYLKHSKTVFMAEFLSFGDTHKSIPWLAVIPWINHPSTITDVFFQTPAHPKIIPNPRTSSKCFPKEQDPNKTLQNTPKIHQRFTSVCRPGARPSRLWPTHFSQLVMEPMALVFDVCICWAAGQGTVSVCTRPKASSNDFNWKGCNGKKRERME